MRFFCLKLTPTLFCLDRISQKPIRQMLTELLRPGYYYANVGFTLAELLIALAILGVIATFTIPKIISAQQNGASNAKAKETTAMVSGAFQQYLMNNTLSASTTSGAITPYINYVSVHTAGLIDDTPGSTSRDCSDTTNFICLKLHNGGVLWFEKTTSFSGTSTTNALFYMFDPDSTYSGSASDGPGKSLGFFLYYNGRMTSQAKLVPGTASSAFTWSTTYPDPSWFSW